MFLFEGCGHEAGIDELKVTSYGLSKGHCIFVGGTAFSIYFPMPPNDQDLLEETPHHLLQTLSCT